MPPIAPLLRLGRMSLKAREMIPLGVRSSSYNDLGQPKTKDLFEKAVKRGKNPKLTPRMKGEKTRLLKKKEELDKLQKELNRKKHSPEVEADLKKKIEEAKLSPQEMARLKELTAMEKKAKRAEDLYNLRRKDFFGDEGLTPQQRDELRLWALGGVDTAMFGLPIAGGIASGVVGDYGQALGLAESDLDAQMRKQQMGIGAQMAMRSQMMREQERINENLARLARINPHAAQELMAGQMLPDNATVIGGAPNQEMLQALGAMMNAQGPTDPMAGAFF